MDGSARLESCVEAFAAGRKPFSLPIVRIRLVTALDPSAGSRDVLLDSENLSYEGKL